MSVREVIETVESLEVGDRVEFTDEEGTEYTGDVVETQRKDDHRNWLVSGDNDTEDCVLEVWYDPEGGPINVQVSFEDGSSLEVVEVSEV